MAQLDDPLDVVDIVPVGDEVQHHRVAMRLDRTGHGQLVSESLFRAGQQVVHLLVGGLKADLDMVKPGLGELGNTRFSQADARGDQVGVITQITRGLDQLGQVLTHQRLATGETQLCSTQLTGLAEHLDPLGSAQFGTLLGEIQRVGAVWALQRAAVGQFGQQPQRRPWFMTCFSEARSRTEHWRPP